MHGNSGGSKFGRCLHPAPFRDRREWPEMVDALRPPPVNTHQQNPCYNSTVAAMHSRNAIPPINPCMRLYHYRYSISDTTREIERMESASTAAQRPSSRTLNRPSSAAPSLPINAGNASAAPDGLLPPDLYLDRHGVTTCVRDAMSLLAENRPRDPLDFLATYFRSVVDGASPLDRSYQCIRLSAPHRAVFFDNLLSSYLAMDVLQRGLSVADFTKLLKAICAEFPVEILRFVLAAYGPLEPDSLISYEQFELAVRACVLYEEVIRLAETLFIDLDKTRSRRVPLAEFTMVWRGSSGAQSSPEQERVFQRLVRHLSEIAGESGPSGITYPHFLQSLLRISAEDE